MSAQLEHCARYRVYTAALADGERQHAPWRARWHIRRCRGCAQELASQASVTSRVRQALAVPEPVRIPQPRYRSLGVLVAAGVAGAVAAAVVAGVVVGGHRDPLPDAIAAAARPVTFLSADPVAIDRWCHAGGAAAPRVLVIPALQLEGARMDAAAETMLVTVYYEEPGGRLVEVTWMARATSPRPETLRSAVASGGHTVLVVGQGSADVAVITGTADTGDLWHAGAAIAATM